MEDQITAPLWVDEFRDKFSGGLAHTFIVHGAIEDYVGEQRTRLDHYLSELLGSTRVVVFYNCSRGISFAAPTHRTAFLDALSIKKEDAPAMHETFLPEPVKALPLLEKALLAPDLKGKMALIIEYPELVWPNSDFGHLSERDRIALATLRRWATGSDFITAKACDSSCKAVPGIIKAQPKKRLGPLFCKVQVRSREESRRPAVYIKSSSHRRKPPAIAKGIQLL